MNVSDFISEAEFNEILQRAEKKEAFEVERSFKVNGNWYCFNIRCGFDYYNQYNIWPHFDYNYSDKKYGRQIGGGSFSVDCSNWNSFKSDFESGIKKYPDYREPEQLSFF